MYHTSIKLFIKRRELPFYRVYNSFRRIYSSN